ncbi:LCP family protein [Kocuria turfanensis]|uniref:LCP family protein n=1 Tax=Kocuria turfanensis TaxID=388357 RepID=UPI0040362B66
MSIDDRDLTRADPAPRRRHPVRTVLLVLVTLLLVLALLVGLFVWNLGRTFDDRKRTLDDAFPDDSTRPAAGSAQDRGTTVLLLGADGGAEDGGQRADSIMLVHVPEDGGEAYVMSIMRDTWVEIPGVGQAKINAALDHGGTSLMVQTVEDLFGTRVDQVAEVDFEGFRGLTDAVGGVTIDVPQDFVSRSEGIVFEAGPQTMDGATALEFVRERYAFETGDFQRVQNQRTYVQAMMDQLISPETLTNPMRIHSVVAEFSPYLEVSEGLDAGWIAGLAPDLAGLTSGDIEMLTVPNRGIGVSPDGQSIIVADEDAMSAVGVAISEDNLDEYVATLN